MKIRNGFVSNSSSSSFTCEVCGETASGMDMCLSESGMIECENGHTFCTDHGPKEGETDKKQSYLDRITRKMTGYKNKKKMESWEQSDLEELEKYHQIITGDDNDAFEEIEGDLEGMFEDDGVPCSACPICSFEVLTDADAFAYMLKSRNLTAAGVLSEIKMAYVSYLDFKKDIKGAE